MRIFKSKPFVRFARKEGISDAKLCKVVKDVEDGRIDVDYGGCVIKQRVARPHEGKSGGYRCVILYRKGNRAFFVYGFAKSDRENIDDDEVEVYKEAAKFILACSDEELARLIKIGTYEEVRYRD